MLRAKTDRFKTQNYASMSDKMVLCLTWKRKPFQSVLFDHASFLFLKEKVLCRNSCGTDISVLFVKGRKMDSSL